jgi:hypothetical protein
VAFKANAKCRHHIPKQKRRVTNWPAYEASLRQRGDLTIWFSEDAIAAWRAVPRDGFGFIGPKRQGLLVRKRRAENGVR